MKLSVVIIAKNAENQIADCIESVRFAGEIIVIDNGSEDRTVEVAKSLKALVITDKKGDFSMQRTIGLEKAKGEWILYIDTDERVTKDLEIQIERVCKSADSLSAYKIARQNFYFGNYEWPKIEYLERLFKKSKLKGWSGKLHESPKIEGEVGLLKGQILHFTHRDLESMLDKTIEWSDIEAKLRFDSVHPPMATWRFIRVIITAFWGSYVSQQGFKAGTAGLVESVYQSFSMLITYAKLWELQQIKISASSKT